MSGRYPHDEPAEGLRAAARLLDEMARKLDKVAEQMREAADTSGGAPVTYEVWIGHLSWTSRRAWGLLELLAGETGRHDSSWRDVAGAAQVSKSTAHGRWHHLELTRETVRRLAAVGENPRPPKR